MSRINQDDYTSGYGGTDDKNKLRKRFVNPWEYKSLSDTEIVKEKKHTKCYQCMHFKLWYWIFRRTPKECIKLILFFIIFYSALALLFIICLVIYLKLIVKDDRPMTQDIIKSNRELIFYPWDEDTAKVSMSDQKKLSPMFAMLAQVEDKRYEECLDPDPKWTCLYVRPARIYGWVPQTFSASDPLPEGMPEPLKRRIRVYSGEDLVWLWCDKATKKGSSSDASEFKYIPYPGFPARFFPFKNQPGYRDPVVAIRVNLTTGLLITVRCNSWAKNVHPRRQGFVKVTLNITK